MKYKNVDPPLAKLGDGKTRRAYLRVQQKKNKGGEWTLKYAKYLRVQLQRARRGGYTKYFI